MLWQKIGYFIFSLPSKTVIVNPLRNKHVPSIIKSFFMKISLLTAIAACFLFSCNDAKESKTETKTEQETQSNLLGKWRYEKIEKLAEGTSPEDASARDEVNKGLTVIFNADGVYYSLKETDSITDTLETGRYEIINNGEQLVTTGSASAIGDTVRIVELTGNTLKVETPTKDILLIKKVN